MLIWENVPERRIAGSWERLLEEKDQLEMLIDCCLPLYMRSPFSFFIDDTWETIPGSGVASPPNTRLKGLTEELLVEALEQTRRVPGSREPWPRPRLKAT